MSEAETALSGQPHCPFGHLSPDQIETMYERYLEGARPSDLMAEFDVGSVHASAFVSELPPIDCGDRACRSCGGAIVRPRRRRTGGGSIELARSWRRRAYCSDCGHRPFYPKCACTACRDNGRLKRIEHRRRGLLTARIDRRLRTDVGDLGEVRPIEECPPAMAVHIATAVDDLRPWARVGDDGLIRFHPGRARSRRISRNDHLEELIQQGWAIPRRINPNCADGWQQQALGEWSRPLDVDELMCRHLEWVLPVQVRAHAGNLSARSLLAGLSGADVRRDHGVRRFLLNWQIKELHRFTAVLCESRWIPTGSLLRAMREMIPDETLLRWSRDSLRYFAFVAQKSHGKGLHSRPLREYEIGQQIVDRFMEKAHYHETHEIPEKPFRPPKDLPPDTVSCLYQKLGAGPDIYSDSLGYWLNEVDGGEPPVDEDREDHTGGDHAGGQSRAFSTAGIRQIVDEMRAICLDVADPVRVVQVVRYHLTRGVPASDLPANLDLMILEAVTASFREQEDDTTSKGESR